MSKLCKRCGKPTARNGRAEYCFDCAYEVTEERIKATNDRIYAAKKAARAKEMK